MRRIYGKLEPALLLACGAVILYYAFSDHYSILMNPRFKWLTVTGAALLTVVSISALASSIRRPADNIVVFTLMLITVALGLPYFPNATDSPGQEPEPDQGMLAEIDLLQFPRLEFQYIFRDARRMANRGEGFTIVGTAKRLDELDKHSSFAIMTSVMYCCLADIFATGYRVAYDDWANIDDGKPLLISGRFAMENQNITVPNFRFGRSMFSTVDQEYQIVPDRIIAYNRQDELPRLTELLRGENVEKFTGYLQETGLLDKLDQEAPFTVFVPVDKAITALGQRYFEKMPVHELKHALELHVTSGKLFSSDLMKLDNIKSINGEVLDLNLNNGKLTIEGCRFLFKDTEAKSGVIHFIYPAIVKDLNEND